MTAYTGTIYTIASSVETTIAGDSLAFQQVSLSTSKFLNSGYYVSGTTYEYWITFTAPSATNPSGHVLTSYQYVKLI
jgi:hypothetical protein